VLIGLAAVLLIIDGIGSIQQILAASFLALNLVLVVWPIQSLLARALPRVVASLIAGVVAIAILLGLIWSIAWAIAQLITALPDYAGPFNAMVTAIREFLEQNNIKTRLTWEEAWSFLSTLNITSIVSNLSSVATSLGSALWVVVLIVMILIFMVMDSMSFPDRMKRLAERHNATLAWALNTFAKGVRRYWIVCAVFGLIVAGCDWVLLSALGVPLAAVWAVFSFVTNFIPNVGFVIGLIPPVIMAFLDAAASGGSGELNRVAGLWAALWVIIGYSIINVLFQSFIQPRVTGEAVGITATVAVLSLLVWAVVLGPLGAILAIPATLLVKTLFVDIDPRARWVNALIASNPKTSEEDPIKLSELLERANACASRPARLQRDLRAGAAPRRDKIGPERSRRCPNSLMSTCCRSAKMSPRTA